MNVAQAEVPRCATTAACRCRAAATLRRRPGAPGNNSFGASYARAGVCQLPLVARGRWCASAAASRDLRPHGCVILRPRTYVTCEPSRLTCAVCTNAAKCTFIILDRALPDTPGTGVHGGGMARCAASPPQRRHFAMPAAATSALIYPRPRAQAGDVNIFLKIMVAERRSRRRGIAREALGLMMRYAAGA